MLLLSTFLDVYNAVECVDNGELFHFHENPNAMCPVGRNIHNVLDEKLYCVQKAMEAEMDNITLAKVAEDVQEIIAKENN